MKKLISLSVACLLVLREDDGSYTVTISYATYALTKPNPYLCDCSYFN